MHPISNFFLSSRSNAASNSFFERAGDVLLTPTRMLLGGREVVVLNDASVHAMNLMEIYTPHFSRLTTTVLKILIAVTLPFSLIGSIIKLPCLKEKNYREFCMQKLPQDSSRIAEIFQHVHSIRSFVTYDFSNFSSELVFHPPSLAALGLYECACSNTGSFDRLKNPRRENLEKAIIQHLAKIHPDKNQPIHLLSMGSGGLMSDFITLEKLILKGFKNISIDCVEPEGIDPKKTEGIREFFSKCSGISVNIHAYKDIKDIQEERDYSAVLAVDYDALASFSWKDSLNSLTDLVKARNLLNENGFLALGCNEDDTLSGKTMETITLTSSSLIESLTSDLAQQLEQKNELLLALSSFEFAGVAHLLLYAVSLAIEKSGKSYNRISIAALSERDSLAQAKEEERQAMETQLLTRFPTLSEEYQAEEQARKNKKRQAFETMSQVLFPTTKIEVCCHEQGKKYDLLFTGSLEKEFISENYLTLLDEKARSYIMHPQGNIYRQNSDRQNESIQVFSSNKKQMV